MSCLWAALGQVSGGTRQYNWMRPTANELLGVLWAGVKVCFQVDCLVWCCSCFVLLGAGILGMSGVVYDRMFRLDPGNIIHGRFISGGGHHLVVPLVLQRDACRFCAGVVPAYSGPAHGGENS